MTGANTPKILAILAFTCLTLALSVIARTPPASGYELSLYNAYPSYFWVLLVIATVCGIGILVQQLASEQKSRWWLAGLAIVIFSNLILLALPPLRGYALLNPQDMPIHLGHAKDIAATGHIGSSNMYPAMHLLFASLQIVTGLSENLLAYVVTAVFCVLFLLGICLLAASLGNSLRHCLIVVAFAAVPIFGMSRYLTPVSCAVSTIPLLLYLYHRGEQSPYGRTRYAALLLISTVFITLLHPVTALLLVTTFLTFRLAPVLYRVVYRRTPVSVNEVKPSMSYAVVIIVILAVSAVWILMPSVLSTGQPETASHTATLSNYLGRTTADSVAGRYTELLTRANLSTSQFMELTLRMLGNVILYFVISFVVIILMLRRRISSDHSLHANMFTYGTLFISALLVSTVLFFTQASESGMLRILRMPIVLAIVLNGIAISWAAGKGPQHGQSRVGRLFTRGRAVALTMIALIACTVISVFNFYPSPLIGRPNFQVTQMDVAGTRWLLEHHTEDVTAVCTRARVENIQVGILGVEAAKQAAVTVRRNIPPHLGYDENESIAEAFGNETRYVAIGELDRIFPTVFPENVRPEVKFQYNEDDFARLDCDPTGAQVYTNGELGVWRIEPSYSGTGHP